MVARFVVAGTHSGVGKTTVATGLMAAFRSRGTKVASAKVGPDFIDPGYHSLATGRAARNLDAWISGPEAIPGLARRAAADADLLVVEGVMGLFDRAADGQPSSTADIAALIDAPVLLVVDASAMSASVAALVRGFRDHDPTLRFAGVILNRVAGDRHREMLLDALAPIGVEVLGCLMRDEAFTWRDRHLGLVPVEERRAEAEAQIDALAASISRGCDLDAIERVARSAPPIPPGPDPRPVQCVGSARVAVAAGKAFTFMYRDNLEALAAAGAELIPFDPLHDEHLPAGVTGLVIGGGFPEVYVQRLAENRSLLAEVRSAVTGGLITWAECGGLLWLCQSLDGVPLVGAVDGHATLTSRLTLGYRHAKARRPNPVMHAGETLRGHEFHYSRVSPTGDAIAFESRFGDSTDGFATETLLATYLHQHLGADPAPAERFVSACAQRV